MVKQKILKYLVLLVLIVVVILSSEVLTRSELQRDAITIVKIEEFTGNGFHQLHVKGYLASLPGGDLHHTQTLLVGNSMEIRVWEVGIPFLILRIIFHIRDRPFDLHINLPDKCTRCVIGTDKVEIWPKDIYALKEKNTAH